MAFEDTKRQEEQKLKQIDIQGPDHLSDSSKTSLKLPERLEALYPLSRNLYWVWNRRIRRLFEEIDHAAWDGLGHNPALLLQRINEARFAELNSNQEFVAKVARVYEVQRHYLHGKKDGTWFRKTFAMDDAKELVAYFSAEFGLTECLRTYSGGLGILSGDHLKSASDLGIPIVGVGIFYKRGYFSQQVNQEGWQVEAYPENNPLELPIEPLTDRNSSEPLIVSVPIEDRQVRVKTWRVSVGRATLLLLDTNLPGLNSKEDCEITAELYGGDVHTRIKQEIVLGFGGSKVLRALGTSPTLYHLNEGHAAFAILERIREIMEEDKRGSSFSDAKELARSACLFTTHTPVSAGIDVFEKGLVEKYLGWYSKKLGIDFEQLFELGREYPDSPGFNMAVFAIRMSKNVNAVSKLHKRVASKLWQHVVIERGSSDSIGSVTNGIHAQSWTADSFADLFDKYLGPEWDVDESNLEVWERIKDIPDELLWKIHCEERSKLIQFVRTGFSFAGYKLPIDKILDPNALTIGFSRRFATYKRATLILSEKERILKHLANTERPIQFIFAGKAHPRDHEAKKLIQEIQSLAKSEEGCGRIVFLPDYDITIARRMVQGVDLWLNNPQRPLEACGTSGMKVLSNGVLNFSVLDGWWDEAHSPEYGWTINPIELHGEPLKQAKADAEALFATLEGEIIPDYFTRNEKGVPTRWVEKMKHSISTLSPRFTSQRMVKEYATQYYFRT